MSLTRFFYDPFDDFETFLSDGYPASRRRRDGSDHANAVSRPFTPKMDLKDVENNQVMATIELPGLKKENINIDVHNDRLTISGETESSTEKSGDGGFTVRERSYGKFTRVLPLPRGTKPEEVKASMENGVLTLTFPKTAAENAPARIAIN